MKLVKLSYRFLTQIWTNFKVKLNFNLVSVNNLVMINICYDNCYCIVLAF